MKSDILAIKQKIKILIEKCKKLNNNIICLSKEIINEIDYIVCILGYNVEVIGYLTLTKNNVKRTYLLEN